MNLCCCYSCCRRWCCTSFRQLQTIFGDVWPKPSTFPTRNNRVYTTSCIRNYWYIHRFTHSLTHSFIQSFIRLAETTFCLWYLMSSVRLAVWLGAQWPTPPDSTSTTTTWHSAATLNAAFCPSALSLMLLEWWLYVIQQCSSNSCSISHPIVSHMLVEHTHTQHHRLCAKCSVI